jgi:hypothetical protein
LHVKSVIRLDAADRPGTPLPPSSFLRSARPRCALRTARFHGGTAGRTGIRSCPARHRIRRIVYPECERDDHLGRRLHTSEWSRIARRFERERSSIYCVTAQALARAARARPTASRPIARRPAPRPRDRTWTAARGRPSRAAAHSMHLEIWMASAVPVSPPGRATLMGTAIQRTTTDRRREVAR